jgi:hypothetical protein
LGRAFRSKVTVARDWPPKIFRIDQAGNSIRSGSRLNHHFILVKAETSRLRILNEAIHLADERLQQKG